MTPKNRIIALIDFSEYSETLIKVAAMFMKVIHSDVVLVHQIPGLIPAMADSEGRNQIINFEKEEALDKLNNLIKDHFYYKVSYVISEKNILTILNELKSDESVRRIQFI